MNLEEDSDDDQTDRKKIKQDTSGRIGKLIIVNDGDSNSNGTKDHQDNIDGASSLIGEFGSVSLSHTNTNPNPPVPTFNLSWNTSALRLWSNSTGPYRILNPGSFSGTALSIAASGGSASFFVEGLQGSTAPGDQIVTVSQGNLRAEVRFTVLKGNLRLLINGTETTEADESKPEESILGTPETDKAGEAMFNIDPLLPSFASGHLRIEGNKKYLLWKDKPNGDLEEYGPDSSIPLTGLSGLNVMLLEPGDHSFQLKYVNNNRTIVLDTISMHQRDGAFAVDDYFAANYEGPNTSWEFNILSNDHVGDTTPGQIVNFNSTSRGTLTRFGEGPIFTYRPYDGMYGPDSFSYTVVNDHGEYSTAHVRIDVQYVPEVIHSTLNELDPDGRVQLQAIHRLYLENFTKQILGDSLGADFAIIQGTAAMERLVAIARWGWTFRAATQYSGSTLVDGNLVDTGTHRITYYDRYLLTPPQGYVNQGEYSRIQICADIARLSRNNQITEHNWGYDASGGSPALAGTKAFLAHKNTRIVAGIVGTAVVVATLPVSMGLAASAAGTGTLFTLGTTTVTTAGVAQAGVFAASSWAILRGIDDVGSTAFLNEGDPTLLTQGVIGAAGLFFNEPATAANNLITSIDIATFIVDVAPGFSYMIKGKRVFDAVNSVKALAAVDDALRTAIIESAGFSGKQVSLLGRWLGSKKLSQTQIAKYENDLAQYGVILKRGSGATEVLDKYGARAGFSSLENSVYLRKNATFYDAFHELQHVKHRARIGREAYENSKLTGTYAKELFVYEQILDRKHLFNSKELEHAKEYIDGLYTLYRRGAIN